MDLQSIVFAPRNDLPYALFLPGLACAAQYHGKLAGPPAKSPAAARSAAEDFIAEEYLAALHAGARLPDAKRRRVAKRVSELTGLPVALVEEKNLRISDETFFFELLRNEGRIVGRLEARVTGPMAASRTRDWEFDPGIEALAAPYTMAAHAYMSETLGIDTTARYEVLNMEVNEGGTGIAAKRRATASPARVPISPARCAAIRTCACWSRAGITTSAHRIRRPTGRSRSSTLRRRCWRASSIIISTPAT